LDLRFAAFELSILRLQIIDRLLKSCKFSALSFEIPFNIFEGFGVSLLLFSLEFELISELFCL
jgi:hypothetical protein